MLASPFSPKPAGVFGGVTRAEVPLLNTYSSRVVVGLFWSHAKKTKDDLLHPIMCWFRCTEVVAILYNLVPVFSNTAIVLVLLSLFMIKIKIESHSSISSLALLICAFVIGSWTT